MLIGEGELRKTRTEANSRKGVRGEPRSERRLRAGPGSKTNAGSRAAWAKALDRRCREGRGLGFGKVRGWEGGSVLGEDEGRAWFWERPRGGTRAGSGGQVLDCKEEESKTRAGRWVGVQRPEERRGAA